MNKNFLNKNLTIYKIENLLNNQNLLLLISIKLGWQLFPLYPFKNKTIEPIIYGYSRLYKFFFKIKGFGFKWKYLLRLNKKKCSIYLKLGFTHRVSLIIKNNCKCKLKKRRLIIKHRSNMYLRNQLHLLFFLYKTHLYNKKGIYLRGNNFKLKLSKKKSKF